MVTARRRRARDARRTTQVIPTEGARDSRPSLRYRAFLSYCHRDGEATARLHRRLETYSVPRALRGTQADGRVVPARIHPVFRDRDELATAAQLSRTIEEALDASEALVVVCSPAAVASPWVNAEIAYFRRVHHDRPVFAFVVAGDPGLDPTRDPRRAAFPPSLLVLDPDHPEAGVGEPIAADAREEGDGFSAAFLKLAAGLLGVRYDQLRRRDQRRRQQRWMLATASGLLLSAVFAFLAWQATIARDAARIAQSAAELELQSERQTRDFLLSVFQLADATEARGDRVTVREVLDRAVQRIDRTEFTRPAIRARYLATMGQAYSSLGLNRRSVELLRASLGAIQDETLDPVAQTQRGDSRIALADTLFDMGEYEAALKELDQLEAPATMAVLSPLQRAQTANIRGDVLTYLERDAEAHAAFEAALAALALRASDAAGEAEQARSLSGRATLQLFAGDAADAEQGFAESLALLRRTLGSDHPRSISTTASLGSAAYRNGRRDAAREVWQEALRLAASVYDSDNPQIGTIKSNLGVLLLEDGELDQAEPLLRDALASDRKHRGDAFDDLAYPLHNLGYLLFVTGRHDEAAQLLEEGLLVAEQHKHRMRGPILNALADLRCTTGAAEAGRALADRAVAAYGDAEPADAWRAAQARLTQAYCRAQQGESVSRSPFAADVKQVRERWPRTNPFRARSEAQLKSLR